MHVEITPEPSPEERAALVQALEVEGGSVDAYGSVWRLAGLLESVDSDDTDDPRNVVAQRALRVDVSVDDVALATLSLGRRYEH